MGSEPDARLFGYGRRAELHGDARPMTIHCTDGNVERCRDLLAAQALRDKFDDLRPGGELIQQAAGFDVAMTDNHDCRPIDVRLRQGPAVGNHLGARSIDVDRRYR